MNKSEVKNLEKILKKEYINSKDYFVCIDSIDYNYLEDEVFITIEGRYGKMNDDQCEEQEEFELCYIDGESIDYIRGLFSQLLFDREVF